MKIISKLRYLLSKFVQELIIFSLLGASIYLYIKYHVNSMLVLYIMNIVFLFLLHKKNKTAILPVFLFFITFHNVLAYILISLLCILMFTEEDELLESNERVKATYSIINGIYRIVYMMSLGFVCHKLLYLFIGG